MINDYVTVIAISSIVVFGFISIVFIIKSKNNNKKYYKKSLQIAMIEAYYRERERGKKR
jgi:hypothetical protein